MHALQWYQSRLAPLTPSVSLFGPGLKLSVDFLELQISSGILLFLMHSMSKKIETTASTYNIRPCQGWTIDVGGCTQPL
jgi:hypothetical protein